MLTMTNDARMAIQQLVAPAPAPDEAGIRITATSSADTQTAELAITVAEQPAPGDQVVDEEGARVFLDAAAADMLSEQTLDVQIDQEAKRVEFLLK